MSLEEVESNTRRICGFSEIDYEREKATRLWPETRNEAVSDGG